MVKISITGDDGDGVFEEIPDEFGSLSTLQVIISMLEDFKKKAIVINDNYEEHDG